MNAFCCNMKSGSITLIFLLAKLFLVQGNLLEDVCNSKAPELHRSKYRGTLCKMRAGKITSDRTLESGWYNVTDNDGPLTMPTHPVELLACSTRYPIWLNGTYPSVAEGIVNRTTCVASPKSNCSREIDIKIVNCGSFYLHHLQRTVGTDDAFCFGSGKNCLTIDPCEDIDRGPDLQIEDTMCSPQGQQNTCQFQLRDEWHRIKRASSFHELPDFCDEYVECGIKKPIWLNGTIPRESDGIMTLEGCLPDGQSCCGRTEPVMVKHCGDYFAYKMKPTDCQSTYCNFSCSQYETTTTSVMVPLWIVGYSNSIFMMCIFSSIVIVKVNVLLVDGKF